MKIYYAHSMLTYNTVKEKQELKWLKKKYEVIDPNNDIGEQGIIEPYLKAISKCQGIICSEYEKHIGKGVYLEIEHALKLKLPVRCLRKNYLGNYLKDVKGLQVVNEWDWKVYYGKVKIQGGSYETKKI